MVDILRRAKENPEPQVITALAQRWSGRFSHSAANAATVCSPAPIAPRRSRECTNSWDWQRPRPKTQSKSIRRRDTPRLGPTPVRYCIPHRMHPRNPSSTLPNQSRSAKPAGTITSSSSPADFRTPPPPPSNLHSARQPSDPTSRAFLHWRLSDDGPGASRIVSIGRPDLADQAGHVGFVPQHRTKCAALQSRRGRAVSCRNRNHSMLLSGARPVRAGLPPSSLFWNPSRK
jgi:hypothetical protein